MESLLSCSSLRFWCVTGKNNSLYSLCVLLIDIYIDLFDIIKYSITFQARQASLNSTQKRSYQSSNELFNGKFQESNWGERLPKISYTRVIIMCQHFSIFQDQFPSQSNATWKVIASNMQRIQRKKSSQAACIVFVYKEGTKNTGNNRIITVHRIFGLIYPKTVTKW